VDGARLGVPASIYALMLWVQFGAVNGNRPRGLRAESTCTAFKIRHPPVCAGASSTPFIESDGVVIHVKKREQSAW